MITAKEWFEKYKNEIGKIENFDNHKYDLRKSGLEYFEFEGVKIRTDISSEYERIDAHCYERFKCEENPFGQENLYLTLNYSYDSWSGRDFLYASFDYPQEVQVIQYFQFENDGYW